MFSIRLYSAKYRDTYIRLLYDRRYYDEYVSPDTGSFWLSCRAGNYPWDGFKDRFVMSNNNDLGHSYFAMVF